MVAATAPQGSTSAAAGGGGGGGGGGGWGRRGASSCAEACDARRLSYKRACDPDKRVSLAFDSMLSEDDCSDEHSFCSRSNMVGLRLILFVCLFVCLLLVGFVSFFGPP